MAEQPSKSIVAGEDTPISHDEVSPDGRSRGHVVVHLLGRVLAGLVIAVVGVVTIVVIVFGLLALGFLTHPETASLTPHWKPGVEERTVVMGSWFLVGGFLAGFVVGFGPGKRPDKPVVGCVPLLAAGLACTTLIGVVLHLALDSRGYYGQFVSDKWGMIALCVGMGAVFGGMGWFWLMDKLGRRWSLNTRRPSV
jgi:hypothetical protein